MRCKELWMQQNSYAECYLCRRIDHPVTDLYSVAKHVQSAAHAQSVTHMHTVWHTEQQQAKAMVRQ
jgi:hypothetical protein